MRFILSQYVGKYAMHCKHKEDAQTFLNLLRNNNRFWCSGESYINIRHDEYKERTCYAFNENRYGTIEWYQSNGYTVLEFDDFEWDDDITPPSSRDLQRLDNFFAQFAVSKL